MLWTYCYVRGRDALERLLKKMGKDKPLFVESFAHVDAITIELTYDKSPSDDGYHDYYILYMKHPKGNMDMSDIRRKVHDDIRNGANGIKKV